MKIIRGIFIRDAKGRNPVNNDAIRLTIQTGDLFVEVECFRVRHPLRTQYTGMRVHHLSLTPSLVIEVSRASKTKPIQDLVMSPGVKTALYMMEEADLSYSLSIVARGVQRMLRKHAVMWTGGILGTIGASEHRIDLAPAARPSRWQRQLARPMEREVVDREVKRIHDAKFIAASMSEWGAPVVIVSKKDESPRFCIDYRTLNLVKTTVQRLSI